MGSSMLADLCVMLMGKCEHLKKYFLSPTSELLTKIILSYCRRINSAC